MVRLPPPAPSAAEPEELPLRIVYQDVHLIVIDKAVGMVVHPSAGHPRGTLVNALLHHVRDLSGIGGVHRPGIVHRLDRGTSGLLVVAKRDVAHQHLAAQFAAHTAGRVYLALCHGAPVADSGTIESWLARHPTARLRWASTEPERGKRAVTHWEVVARRGTVTLMRCRLETGRTHQIRVHLTEQGWPLLGDGLYKRRNTRLPATLRGVVDDSGERPLLHAAFLRFTHPDTEELMELRAPPPTDFQRALDALAIRLPG